MTVVICLFIVFFQNRRIAEERNRAERERDSRDMVKNYLVNVLSETNPYESASLKQGTEPGIH